jgi:hypothetical protein
MSLFDTIVNFFKSRSPIKGIEEHKIQDNQDIRADLAKANFLREPLKFKDAHDITPIYSDDLLKQTPFPSVSKQDINPPEDIPFSKRIIIPEFSTGQVVNPRCFNIYRHPLTELGKKVTDTMGRTWVYCKISSVTLFDTIEPGSYFSVITESSFPQMPEQWNKYKFLAYREELPVDTLFKLAGGVGDPPDVKNIIFDAIYVSPYTSDIPLVNDPETASVDSFLYTMLLEADPVGVAGKSSSDVLQGGEANSPGRVITMPIKETYTGPDLSCTLSIGHGYTSEHLDTDVWVGFVVSESDPRYSNYLRHLEPNMILDAHFSVVPNYHDPRFPGEENYISIGWANANFPGYKYGPVHAILGFLKKIELGPGLFCMTFYAGGPPNDEGDVSKSISTYTKFNIYDRVSSVPDAYKHNAGNSMLVPYSGIRLVRNLGNYEPVDDGNRQGVNEIRIGIDPSYFTNSTGEIDISPNLDETGNIYNVDFKVDYRNLKIASKDGSVDVFPEADKIEVAFNYNKLQSTDESIEIVHDPATADFADFKVKKVSESMFSSPDSSIAIGTDQSTDKVTLKGIRMIVGGTAITGDIVLSASTGIGINVSGNTISIVNNNPFYGTMTIDSVRGDFAPGTWTGSYGKGYIDNGNDSYDKLILDQWGNLTLIKK